jgi:hypothetical protein
MKNKLNTLNPKEIMRLLGKDIPYSQFAAFIDKYNKDENNISELLQCIEGESSLFNCLDVYYKGTFIEYKTNGVLLKNCLPTQSEISLQHALAKLFINCSSPNCKYKHVSVGEKNFPNSECLAFTLNTNSVIYKYFEKSIQLIPSVEKKGYYYIINGHHRTFAMLIGSENNNIRAPAEIFDFKQSPNFPDKDIFTNDIVRVNTMLKIVHLSSLFNQISIEIEGVTKNYINVLGNNFNYNAKNNITKKIINSITTKRDLARCLKKINKTEKEYLKLLNNNLNNNFNDFFNKGIYKELKYDRNLMPQPELGFNGQLISFLQMGKLDWYKYYHQNITKKQSHKILGDTLPPK